MLDTLLLVTLVTSKGDSEMKKLFLGLFALVLSLQAFAMPPAQYIYANRNCDIIIESTGKSPRISKILSEKAFTPVKENTARAQAAEFAYNAEVEHNGPFPVDIKVSVLRRLGTLEYVYLNVDNVGFPHLVHRSIFKVNDMTRQIPSCSKR